MCLDKPFSIMSVRKKPRLENGRTHENGIHSSDDSDIQELEDDLEEIEAGESEEDELQELDEEDDQDEDDQDDDDQDDEDEQQESEVESDEEEEEEGGVEYGDVPPKANQDPVNDEVAFENPEVMNDPSEEEIGKKSKFDRPKLFKSAKNRSKRLIVILEKANLEMVKVGKNFELLNCDDHMKLIRKYKKDPAFCRPDITHQCLLMLFDSPLNRAGLLQVYIHTMNNILIEINPQTRFPRTFKRFANLMVQLLYKMTIRSSQGSEKLLRVIKNPITAHLPVGCKKIGTSFKAEKVIHPSSLIEDPKSEDPIVIVIGAMAHGDIAVDYTETSVSISNYPLSGALACTKIVSAFEEAWGVQ